MHNKTYAADWNEPAPQVRATQVLDETLRDGLQCPSVRHPSLQEKVALLHAMSRLGIDAVNLGIPATSARAQDDAFRLVTEIHRQKLPLVPVLAGRTLEQDMRHILNVCEQSGGTVEAHTFIGSSAIRAYSEAWSLNDLLRRTRAAVQLVARAGLAVTFVTEDTTRSSPRILKPLLLAALDAGASRICLADTVGHADERGIRALALFVRKLLVDSGFTDTPLDFHGHNDRGLALSNALVAAECGIDRVHATAMGIGERCGNTSMELLLANLRGEAWQARARKALAHYTGLAGEALRFAPSIAWRRTATTAPRSPHNHL